MKKAIQHTLFFPHSTEVVWEYLTKAELMAQWLMKTDFQPIVGYDFTFTAGPVPSLDFDGIVYCKVLELVPYKKLSYSWKTGPGGGKITVDSLVVWKLHEKEGG
ncbi:MAG TPA: SRPBCC domain-containing protein, partial [Chitinophagaceae bacterium]|nr:SRPBCC domain-containing protein [Chitinophagaceae bacterium]